MVSDNLVLCIYHPAMHRGATMYVTFYFLLLYPLNFILGRQALSLFTQYSKLLLKIHHNRFLHQYGLFTGF